MNARTCLTWILSFLAAVLQLAFAQEALPVVNVTAFIESVTEGNVSGFRFTSNLTNEVHVYYEYVGTARLRSDFSDPLVTNGVRIPPRIMSVSISVPTINDLIPEETETVTLRLLPNTNYVIGPFSEATFRILDNEVFPPANRLPKIIFTPPGLVPPSNSMAFKAIVSDEDTESLLVRLLIDGAVVDEQFQAVQTNIFTLNWQAPTAGAHFVQIAAYDDRGGWTNTPGRVFQVAVAALAPGVAGSFDENGAVKTSVGTQRSTRLEVRAFVEFDVPASATNLEATLRMDARLYYDQEVFVYPVSGPPSTNILNSNLEFAGGFHTGNYQPNTNGVQFSYDGLEIDVTPWARKAAGGKLGLLIALPSDGSELALFSTFSNISLILTTEETLDAAPHVYWTVNPPKAIYTNAYTIFAAAADIDSKVGKIFLIESNHVVHMTEPNLQSYRFGITLTNLSYGLHRFYLQASSLGKFATSQLISFTVSPTPPTPPTLETPPHRYLGSQGDSQSFYVVDAAGRAHVWGLNDKSQLGLGFTTSREESPKHPITLLPPPSRRFCQIVSGLGHALALMDDGSLYGWGNNFSGQVAHPIEEVVLKPSRIPFPAGVFFFRSVATKNDRASAVDDAGRMWVWGGGNSTLLRGSGSDPTVPFPPGVNFWIDSAIDSAQQMFIGDDHQLYVLGINSNGQLPLPSPSIISNLTKVNLPGAEGWTRIVTCSRYTLAVDTHNQIWGWGLGLYDNFGPTTPRIIQFPKGISGWLDIAVTTRAAMALSEAGELFAWGQASPGVWKDPLAAVATEPEEVSGLPDLSNASETVKAADFIKVQLSPDFLAQIAAPMETPFTIESSPDLKTWSLASTNISSGSGITTFARPLVGAAQFFRIGHLP